MTPRQEQQARLISSCEGTIAELYENCVEKAPNFGVAHDTFQESLHKSIDKFLFVPEAGEISAADIDTFLRSIRSDDLFMALACADGNERAWWEFDHQHRSYLERIARHLASSDLNAREVVDRVYVELYGTRIVEGRRVSKFASFSGKGAMRGWLRTVIWHSLVDLHRASPDEVSLDEMTENVGEGIVHAKFAESEFGGESAMIGDISRKRYRDATVSAITKAFSELESHEKLLLLYYHSENLKLREIARLVENPSSPLRKWFQRKSATRKTNPESKIHESTIMRWLERTYKKILKLFQKTLIDKHNLEKHEIEICLELATQDLATRDFSNELSQDP